MEVSYAKFSYTFNALDVDLKQKFYFTLDPWHEVDKIKIKCGYGFRSLYESGFYATSNLNYDTMLFTMFNLRSDDGTYSCYSSDLTDSNCIEINFPKKKLAGNYYFEITGVRGTEIIFDGGLTLLFEMSLNP